MGKISIRKILWLCFFICVISACNIPLSSTGTENPKSSTSIETILTEMAMKTMEAAHSGTNETTGKTPEPEPSQVHTVDPSKVLNVCLGKEPESLFFYNSSSRSMWSVLESIYDGPFDVMNGESYPRIFEDIQIEKEAVSVSEGSLITNARGELDSLKKGVEMIPAEGIGLCGADQCVFTWDGATPVTMIQTTIIFTIKAGIKWSDGESLTSNDSVFSWKVDADKNVKTSKKLQKLTESYTALDDLRIEWKGVPGFIPQKSSDVFWIPLPEHLLSGKAVADILKDPEVNTSPIGWGAYKIQKWIPGDRITAIRNEYYNSFSETEPFFDQIVFRFLGSAGDNNLAALKSDSCDIIDTTVELRKDLEPILEDVRDGKMAVYVAPQSSWEQITFNLQPAAADQIRFFSDINVRTAIAKCIDRNQLIRKVFYGQTEVPYGFYPGGHALYVPDASALSYDREGADSLLTAAGWVDHDQNPETPRIAQGIEGIPDGTEMILRFETSNSTLRLQIAENISESLQTCGIGVSSNTNTLDQFYAQGPDGPLFGRKFDIAMFGWSGADQFPCSIYLSNQIPTDENFWIGTNVGGYQSSEYDRLCGAARMSNLFSPGKNDDQWAVQKVYAADLPVIPLYFDFSIAVSDVNICGIRNESGSRSLLWNLETLSSSEDSCAVSQWNNIYADNPQ